jgi:hypothetical protein
MEPQKKSDKIEFTISDLYTKRVRLYNKEANLVRDSFLLRMRFPKSTSTFEKDVKLISDSELILNDVNNSYIVVATTYTNYFHPTDISKNFQKVFFNDYDLTNNRYNNVKNAFN